MIQVGRKFVKVFERDGSVIARGAIERIARLDAAGFVGTEIRS